MRGRAFLNQFVCEVEIDDTALFGWSFLLESGLADASKEAFENLLLLIDWALPPKARVQLKGCRRLHVRKLVDIQDFNHLM